MKLGSGVPERIIETGSTLTFVDFDVINHTVSNVY